MTKEEHLKDLEKKPKMIEGKDGSDAWWHFDALYEEEPGEKPSPFLKVVRGGKKRK